MKEIAPSIDAYFKDIKSSKPLSSEAEAEMARRIRGGDDEATEILAKANLKFVVSVAKEYQGLGLPLNDLISAGNLGLLEAVERFDEERGFRFISYSVWWIRQSILQAVSDQSRNVRLPLNRIGQIQKLKKYSLRKLQEGLSSGEIDAAIINEFDIDEEELNFLRIISQYDTSLDAPVEDDDETRLLQDTLMDESQAPTDEQTMTEDEKRVLHEQLSSLPEGEERVLRLYFGLDNNNPMNLEEIGAYVGRTRERVRQIKEKALGRLRHPAKAGILKPLYEP
ncbi:MAG: RNA polymerase subunit sigma [Nanoarchaeota archaeon]|nr:RNA polymerase subunit sigma [Nanoarchaeota archaeon]